MSEASARRVSISSASKRSEAAAWERFDAGAGGHSSTGIQERAAFTYFPSPQVAQQPSTKFVSSS
jgi:hypothetical protein